MLNAFHSLDVATRTLKAVVLSAVVCSGAMLSLGVHAAPVWQQTTNLSSTLGASSDYTFIGTTGTVVYTGQTATNNGPTTQHFGMYLGWNWSYDSNGVATALPWSNADQAYVGGPVSLKITGSHFSGSILLGDIVDDTWVDAPYAAFVGDPEITSLANWNLPLIDFGVIAPGDSVTYDITFAFTFDNQADADDWNRAGSFFTSAEAVQAIPEPGTLALVGLGIVGLGFIRRRKA